ncbi:TonB-dependent receptor [Hydrocarboniclastica marina]|uniref:TonB-dependent receptor n=2 Tax=Hydrocarboniclastica marina TaxID=2259620 RepID=A0A4P7XM33_9ALTE|nr:TonB-dependent receptor [Hydrocarboniclastica marina]
MKVQCLPVVVLSGSLFALVPGLAYSQTAPATSAAAENQATDDSILELDPLVVTPTLGVQTQSQSLASVSVIDQETLRRQDPNSVTDVIRAQPGVDVTGNGSYGKTTSVMIRGISNKATLMLIDGIRLRSATSGGAAWQHLEPRMFERMEIVRGPRGSLYGADAMGGVVQLFTVDGDEEGFNPRASVGTGSFNTQRYSAGLSGIRNGTRFSIAGSHLNTDGAAIREGGSDKGYDNTTGLAKLSHRFDNGIQTGLLALRAEGNTEYNTGDMDYVQQVAGVYGEAPLAENWRSRLTVSEARDESEDFPDASADSSQFDTRTRTVRWDNNAIFGDHELAAGAEYMDDNVSGTTAYSESSRWNRAFFVQGLLDFSPFSLQPSLRYDDNEAFGGETTGSLALGYKLDDHHTLRTSYGTAYRAPTFNDLYYPTGGNPDLNAESSETLEVGARGQYQAFFWDFAVFRTEVDDLIDWAPTPSGLYSPQNIARARIQGAELAAGAELARWDLAAALTFLDPEDRETGNDLERRATQSLRLDADRQLGEWELGGSWTLQNHRYNDAENEKRLAGFGLLDLRATWTFAPLWSARLTVENVTDKQYETAANYINAGRAAFVSVNFGR